MGHWTKTGKTATTYEVQAPGGYEGEFLLVRTRWVEAQYQSAIARQSPGGRVFVCWEAPGRQAASLDGFHRSAKDALEAAQLEWAQKIQLARMALEHAQKGYEFAKGMPRARGKPKAKTRAKRRKAS